MTRNIFQHELVIRSFKILDIGYISAIYFIIGILFARFFDKMYGVFNKKKEDKKSFIRKTFEIIGIMWLSAIVVYAVRNIIELVPFPLDGLYGYEHNRVKELKNAAVFTFIFLYFQKYFKDKIQHYYDNLNPELL